MGDEDREQDKQIGKLWAEVKRLWDFLHGPNGDNGLRSRIVKLEDQSINFATKKDVLSVKQEVLTAIKESKRTGQERFKNWVYFLAVVSTIIFGLWDKLF
ncbi:hypothetical protein [Spirochaeta cellobiosiphila]|uniref:hypothetical protein n=1 Tax=Spirochaeta cellobiosiphila TaxID=504483 RepID=UPI0004269C31|nr:hypothetical protein [Spirochaeta cellobiosiphila]